MSLPKITSLRIYPIKGCGGISVSTIEVSPRGLLGDRQWMIIDARNQFVSQRQLPALSQIKLSRSAQDLLVDIPGNLPQRLESPRGLPEVFQAQVWDSQVQVVETSPELSQALSDYLQQKLRLVEMAPQFHRPIKAKYGQGEVVFADSLPLLVISQESLDELNRRLEDSVPMDRFRPNIVVQGEGQPHAEDLWKKVMMGGLNFRAPKLCVRCVVTTIDQKTGQKSPEPLKTLATYRRGPKGITFGQHLVCEGQGQLEVGSQVLL